MGESFEYIEDYFEDRMNGAERRLFEEKCVSDESFANDVAFYVCQRQAVRGQLLRQKRAEWTEGEASDEMGGRPALVRKLTPRRWILYGAAASVLLVAIGYFALRSPSPRQLAGDYIEKEYGRLSQTMDGTTSGLQQGIAAYNQGDYNRALRLFQIDYTTHPEHKDALRYQGIVYLRTKDYDNALREFEELARTKGLLSNPGSFLQAVTLLRRDAPGDRETARALLQQVVSRRLDGSAEAADWLQKM